MNRREALHRVALLMGGAVVGANLFLEACSRPTTHNIENLFEESTIDFMGDIADTILPPTKSPGAKEAGVGAFFPIMVRDCYTPADQDAFVSFLRQIDETSKAEFDAKFQELTPAQRLIIVDRFDKEAKTYRREKKPEDPNNGFHLFKELTLLGFFTSELGATQARRYVQVPGRYDGDFPYQKGDRAWAT